MQETIVRGRKAGKAELVVYALVALVVLAVPQLLFAGFYSVHHDLAGSILSGQLSYVLGDVFADYSLYFPPAERGWVTLIAFISDVTGLRPDLTAALLTSVAILISVSLAYEIRQSSVGTSPLFLPASAAVLLIVPILFKNVFGLREHFVVLGLWPYLVFRMSYPKGGKASLKLRIFLGIWLGATLLFKYLYSIAVLLTEIADAALRRRPMLLFRTENLLAGGIVALYLFLWLGIDPSQREAIAFATSGIEANLKSARTNFITAVFQSSLAVCLIAAALVFQWPRRETVFGAALLFGAIAASAIQARWYSHHTFPITMAYIAWWWLIAPHIKWWMNLFIALYITSQIVPQSSAILSYQLELREIDTAMAEINVGGKRVGMLSVHLSPYSEYLVANGGMRWNTSANNSYVASALQGIDTRDNAGAYARPIALDHPAQAALHDEMLSLWEDMPPDALLFDNKKTWPLRYVRFEWTTVFAEDKRFTAFMQDYEPVLVHKGKRLEFTYYERKND